jgi:Xaa-Pro aminopeptidase
MEPQRERLSRVRGHLRETGLHGLVVSHESNVFYLSGFRGSSGALLITADRALLFSDFRYRLQAEEQAPGFEFVEVPRGLLYAVAQTACEAGTRVLGYDGAHLTCEMRDELGEGTGGAELVNASGVVEGLRATKSLDEVQRMRRAAAVADEALERMVSLLRPGAVEREVAIEGEYSMRRAGAERAAFDVIVASGPRSALPHAVTTNRELEDGDLVVIDIGAVVSGYCSDMTRTYAVGSPSEEARRIYGLVYCAQRTGAAAAGPGVICGDVDAAARAIIGEAGYAEAFGHGLGHGVGIDVHEAPRLRKGEECPLAAGHVVTVEPGVYLERIGGVRLEDMVLVTETGSETLTQSAMACELPVL